METKWVHCPICHNKTRTKIRPDTRAENLIVFCPKCKNEFLADIANYSPVFAVDRKMNIATL